MAKIILDEADVAVIVSALRSTIRNGARSTDYIRRYNKPEKVEEQLQKHARYLSQVRMTYNLLKFLVPTEVEFDRKED